MRTVIAASVRTYARRYISAGVAVMIAVGFIVAINAFSAAAKDGSAQAVNQQYAGADWGIVLEGDSDDWDHLIKQAADSPGVSATASNWSAYVSASWGSTSRDTLVGSIADAPVLRWQRAVSGSLPGRPDQIAVSDRFATKNNISIGDSISLRSGGTAREFTVSGTTDGVEGPLSAPLYLPEATFEAANATAPNSWGSRDDVVFAGSNAPRTSQDLGTLLTGAELRDKIRLEATDGIDVFAKLIFVFAGISMFVGALVIANTFTILLAQRIRDLALLRCVGATRKQVTRSVVVESIAIGVLGSVAGALLGVGVARLGIAALGHLAPDVPMGSVAPSMAGLLIPAAIGVAVTTLSSLLPARRAAQVSVLQALRPADNVTLASRAGVVRTVAAVALMATGGALLAVGAVGGALAIGMLGGMVSFVGVVLFTPILIPAAIAVTGPVVRRCGLPSALAHANALRNPRRTAATSTALLIGATLITSVVVGSASLSHKVNTSLDAMGPVDVVVSSQSGAMAASTVESLTSIDGVKASAALPVTTLRTDQGDMRVLAVDQETAALARGDHEVTNLARNQMVVPLATDADTVRITTDTGAKTVRTVHALGLGDVAMMRADALADLGARFDGTGSVWLQVAEGADASEVMSAVTTAGGDTALQIEGGLSERTMVLDVLNVVMAVTVGLLAIAVLIALVGVGNTLSLSVLERTRENSLLRALGLERKGLRRMLAAEAVLMASVAGLLGIALGTAYAWFGVQAVTDDLFADSPNLTIPWVQVAAILVVVTVAGLAASVLPGRRVAQIAPAEGLVAQ